MANSNRTKGLLPVVLGISRRAAERICGRSGPMRQLARMRRKPRRGRARREEIGEVVVTGYRCRCATPSSIKKNADVMMDAINAEDIADFPDANLAESLQRLPGIALDRDNGEGRSITVRGLGSDFTRVRLNGLETLSTAAASRFGHRAQPRPRLRLQRVRLRPVQLAAGAQDGLGRTPTKARSAPRSISSPASRSTTRARKLALLGGRRVLRKRRTHNPRVAALLADQWFDDRFGVSFPAPTASVIRKSTATSARPGQSDYAYRSSTWAGNETPAARRLRRADGHDVRHRGHLQSQPRLSPRMTGSDPAAYARAVSGRALQHRRGDSTTRWCAFRR